MILWRPLLLSLAMFALVPTVARAQEDVRALRRTCWEGNLIEQKAEVLEACTALIDSGALRGNDLAFAYRTRGLTHIYNDDPTAAIPELERAAELRPDQAEIYLDQAAAWHEIGNRERTIEAVTRAESLRPGWALTNAKLGGLRFELGDVEAGRANIRAAIRGFPLPEENNLICWYLALANVDLDEAIKACDRAIRAEPRNAAYVDSRAMLKLRLGDFAGAEADYISAYALDRGQAMSLYGRGYARIRLGREQQGRADIVRALEAQPDLAAEWARWGLVP
jgi:tetratricopeptide (TPR) repeat protein